MALFRVIWTPLRLWVMCSCMHTGSWRPMGRHLGCTHGHGIPISLILSFPGWVSGHALCSCASGVLCLYLALRIAWFSDAFPCTGGTVTSPCFVLHFFSFCLTAVHSCLPSRVYFLCVHICACMYVCVCMCAGLHVYMCVHVCACECVHANVYLHVEAPGGSWLCISLRQDLSPCLAFTIFFQLGMAISKPY